MNSTPAAEERNELSGNAKHNPSPLNRPRGTPPRKKVPSFWIVVGCVVVLVGAIWWVNHRRDEAAVGAKGMAGHRHFGFGDGGNALPVVVAVAKVADLRIYLNALGTVTPVSNVTVRTQISGQLMSVSFQEGQLVNKGDLLATIDSRPYEVALEQAQGQFAQAQAQLKSAQADLSRYETLAKQDSIAQQQVDSQSALVAQYQGLVQTDQAAIDNAKLNITYCHVVAPISGRVGLRQVDAGNYVTSGDSAGLVVLTQIKPITVIFTLPEDNVQKVGARLHSGDPIAVDAFDRTQTTRLARGSLSTIDNQVDTTTGTFKLRAVFANEDESLFPNQFVNVRMLLDTETGDIVIPTSAVERGQNGTFAYVVQPDSTVTARAITLGPIEGERVAVLSGLKAGDQVVSDGADKLKEGASVVVQTPPTGPAVPASVDGTTPGQHRHRRMNADGTPVEGGWKPGSGKPGANGKPDADADANKAPQK